jgi:hypothetical protein
MEAIASKLDAVQLQLGHHTAALAALQSIMSKQHNTATADAPLQHCQKIARFADNSASPLDKDELLDQVFGYEGLSEYIYAADVSRRWRGRYLKMCYTKAERADEKLCTCYRRAAITTARPQLALDSKLTMTASEQSKSFVKTVVWKSLEPFSVMTLAKVYDMKWCSEFTLQAAQADNLELLQWLHKVGCPWDLEHVMDAAAWHNSARTLRWLHSVTKP